LLDPAVVAKEVARLAGLDNYPRGKDAGPALVELRDTLQRAPSREAAHRIVSDWLESQTRCPKPSELRAKIAEIRTRGEERARCSYCDGNGAVVRYVLLTFEGNSYKITRKEVLQDFEHYIAVSSWLAEGKQEGTARQMTNTEAIPCPRCSVNRREEVA
jgi:hypothetical protein